MQVEDRGQRGRWQDRGYDLLRQHDVTQFAYVPDAGHRILIDRSLADPEVHSVALTTEPPKFKRDLDPARCRLRFKAALSSA